MISGSADNTLRLWSVQSGKCLFKWEFPTAVKRVAFNETDDQVVCITEQRMGHQGAIRVFDINREGDGTKRSSLSNFASRKCILNRRNRITSPALHVLPRWFKTDRLRIHIHAQHRRHWSPIRQGLSVRRDNG